MPRIVLYLALLLTSGCFAFWGDSPQRGNGNVIERPIEGGSFTRLHIEGPDVNATLAVGAHQVSLKGDENLVSLVKAEVRDGTLFITSERRMEPRPELTVQVPTLSYIEARHSSRLQGQVASSEPLELVLNRGIALRLDGLSVPEVRVKAEGGIDMKLAGQAGTLTLQVADGINVETAALQAETVEISARKGVTATVFASQAVRGALTDGCSVRVAGNPATREVSVSTDSTLTFE